MTKILTSILMVCILVFGAFMRPAEAHAKLVTSVPVADATVTAPQEIVLTFSQIVQPLQAKLTDLSTQTATELTAPKVDGAAVHYQVGRVLRSGKYELTYRAATPDTHVATGIITFTVSDQAK